MDDVRGALERLEKAVVALTAQMQPALPLLLTVKAAAAQLSVSERTMRTLLATGEVASVVVGGRRMVPSAELVRLAQPVALDAVRQERAARRARVSVDGELAALAVLRRK